MTALHKAIATLLAGLLVALPIGCQRAVERIDENSGLGGEDLGPSGRATGESGPTTVPGAGVDSTRIGESGTAPQGTGTTGGT